MQIYLSAVLVAICFFGGTEGQIVFTEHPQSSILGKADDRYTIQCKATGGADRISVLCDDGRERFNKATPLPGLTTEGSEISAISDIEKSEIERNTRNGESFNCFCRAEAASGESVTSNAAELRIAYLKKTFKQEPHPIQRVRIGASAEICATPPEGLPEPEVSWYKNGRPLTQQEQNSVYVTRRLPNRHCLIFSTVDQRTAANYTCVATNSALQTRTSIPSRLSVYVDGGWSEWGAWSECNVSCGLGMSSRFRYCDSPVPLNDGSACPGSAVETKQCTILCQQDGNWSPWSAWNACNTACIHHRTRKCDNPAPRNGGADCVGETIDHANCTGGHCARSYVADSGFGGSDDAAFGKPGMQDASDDLMVYSFIMALALLFFAAVLLAAFFLCYKKYKYICRITGAGPYPNISEPHQFRSASYSPAGVFVKHENGEIVTRLMGPRAPPDVTQTLSDGTFYKPLYVDPTCSTPLDKMTPISKVASSRASSAGVYSKSEAGLPLLPDRPGSNLPAFNEEPHLDTAMYEKLGGHYQSIGGMSQKSPLPQPEESDYFSQCSSEGAAESDSGLGIFGLPSNFPENSIAYGKVGHSGGRLCLPEAGISLMIPEGAVPLNEICDVYLAVSRDSHFYPSLENHALLSPVILCGPSGGLKLLKPVVLSFYHCIHDASNDWNISLLANVHPDQSSVDWKQLTTLSGEEDSSTFCQIDETRCHVILKEIHSSFVLIGQSNPCQQATKRLTIACFAPLRRPLTQEICMRVYCVDDTRDALENVLEVEERLGGVLVDTPKTLLFCDSNQNLCMTVDSINYGWRSKLANNCQEIPFNHVWHTTTNLHASFTVEHVNSNMRSLYMRINVFQSSTPEEFQTVSVVYHIDQQFEPPAVPQPGLTETQGVVFRLNASTRGLLQQLLDQPSEPAGNDWRMLARKLKIDRYQTYFGTQCSPTEAVLSLWEARNREDRAVTDLAKVLRNMGRGDCALLLQPESGIYYN